MNKVDEMIAEIHDKYGEHLEMYHEKQRTVMFASIVIKMLLEEREKAEFYKTLAYKAG